MEGSIPFRYTLGPHRAPRARRRRGGAGPKGPYPGGNRAPRALPRGPLALKKQGYTLKGILQILQGPDMVWEWAWTDHMRMRKGPGMAPRGTERSFLIVPRTGPRALEGEQAHCYIIVGRLRNEWSP